MDALLQERQSATSASSMVDELSALAGSVLGNLQGQRGTLKAAHRKVLDVRTSLGMSNSVMRMVERRTAGDTILVCGGFAVLLSLVGLVFWWLRR